MSFYYIKASLWKFRSHLKEITDSDQARGKADGGALRSSSTAWGKELLRKPLETTKLVRQVFSK